MTADVFSAYERGLDALLERLGREHPRYVEALTLQARLLENIARAREYGDTETVRAERAQILAALSQLTTVELGLSFVKISKNLTSIPATCNGVPENSQGTDEVAHILENAYRSATKDSFVEALEMINLAYRFAANPIEIAFIEKAEEDIFSTRSLRIQSLEQELSSQLEKPIEELTEENVESIGAILHLLFKIHPEPSVLESERERWLSLRRAVEVHRAYTETKVKLEELWHSPYVLLSRYDEALSLARRMVNAYPDQSCFVELLRDAEKHRKEAYKRSGELTTQAVVGNLQSLVDELLRLYEQGADILPWFEWQGRSLVMIRNEEAGLAIKHLLGLATAYYSNKALEYRKRAEADLPHNPESAAEWIEVAQRFPYLSEQDRLMLQHFFRETVSPNMERRKRAKELVEQALRLDRAIAQAWMLLQEAETLDPHYVGIKEARESLRPLLRFYIEKELRRAEQELVTGGVIEDVAEMTTSLWPLLEGNPDLEDYRERMQLLIRRCQKRSDRENQVHSAQ